MSYPSEAGPVTARDGYYHADAGSVGDALARCLRFVPPEQAR